MTRYSVTVGNVGTVLSTDVYGDAIDYCELSEDGYGRVAGEPVTLMHRGEPLKEYHP